MSGADWDPDARIMEIEAAEDTCRECGINLGAGYLCDDCDEVEGWDDG